MLINRDGPSHEGSQDSTVTPHIRTPLCSGAIREKAQICVQIPGSDSRQCGLHTHPIVYWLKSFLELNTMHNDCIVAATFLRCGSTLLQAASPACLLSRSPTFSADCSCGLTRPVAQLL